MGHFFHSYSWAYLNTHVTKVIQSFGYVLGCITVSNSPNPSRTLDEGMHIRKNDLTLKCSLAKTTGSTNTGGLFVNKIFHLLALFTQQRYLPLINLTKFVSSLRFLALYEI